MALIFQYQEMMTREDQSAYIAKLLKQPFLMQKKNIKASEPESKKVLVEKIKTTPSTNAKKKKAAVKDKILKNKKESKK